jgi:hypothetical protein
MDKMQPEAAVEILRKHGREVTIEEAKQIVDFIYMLAEIAVAQWLRNEDSGLIHTSEHGRTGR